jgi:hypothetical protein
MVATRKDPSESSSVVDFRKPDARGGLNVVMLALPHPTRAGIFAEQSSAILFEQTHLQY